MNLDGLKYQIKNDKGLKDELLSLITEIVPSINGVRRPYTTAAATKSLNIGDIFSDVVLLTGTVDQTITLPSTGPHLAGRYILAIRKTGATKTATIKTGDSSPVTIATLTEANETVTVMNTDSGWAIVSGSTPAQIGAEVAGG